MNLVFLGFGTIANLIYLELVEKKLSSIEVVGVLDPWLTEARISELKEQGLIIFDDLKQLIENSPNLVVEAANGQAVKECVPSLLSNGIDVLSMSVGAYLDQGLMDKVKIEAKGKLYFPSGALPCVDAIKAASMREIKVAELTTCKPPKALLGAPGLDRLKVDIERITDPCIVFSGNALEAVKLFPANVNIAATLSLSGIGPSKTVVKIIADPNIKVNTHSINISGEFGNLNATIECLPSSNPKTSLIAALSAIAFLRNFDSSINIGT